MSTDELHAQTTEWLGDEVEHWKRKYREAAAEAERLRVAADPTKVGAIEKLIRHATRLVQIERDDARKRAETAEATIGNMRRLCDETEAHCSANRLDAPPWISHVRAILDGAPF